MDYFILFILLAIFMYFNSKILNNKFKEHSNIKNNNIRMFNNIKYNSYDNPFSIYCKYIYFPNYLNNIFNNIFLEKKKKIDNDFEEKTTLFNINNLKNNEGVSEVDNIIDINKTLIDNDNIIDINNESGLPDIKINIDDLTNNNNIFYHNKIFENELLDNELLDNKLLEDNKLLDKLPIIDSPKNEILLEKDKLLENENSSEEEFIII